MKAEIITIGDEILIGQIVDTNSQWIATELNKIGISVHQITSIQDDESHILTTLKEAEKRADIVIITGGLGPTKDDITKKNLATYFDDNEIIFYPKVYEHICHFFEKMNRPVNAVQKHQAELPSKATMLFNEYGTAPGMWFEQNQTIFISMPGVPYEMKGLVSDKVLPKLQHNFNLPFIKHTTIHTFGTGESFIAEELSDFENNLPDFVKLAYLPSAGKVRLRLSGKHTDKHLLENTINKLTEEIKNTIPDIIATIGGDYGLEVKIGKLLKEKGKTLGTAESMTGGKLSASIVSVSGSSAYYKGSIISYCAELKKSLFNVSEKIINQHSTVSTEVAHQMATSARKKLNVDYAISITGNAGPSTDHNDKKIGLVYIGIASAEKTEVYQYNFGQPREKVIDRTVTKSLELLYKELLSEL